MCNINIRLSQREEMVMNALWGEKNTVTVPELFTNMYKEDQSITVSTINTALNALMKKGLVETESTEVIGKNRTRRLKPTISAEKFALLEYKRLNGKKDEMALLSEILKTLVSDSDDPISAIGEIYKTLENERKK